MSCENFVLATISILRQDADAYSTNDRNNGKQELTKEFQEY